MLFDNLETLETETKTVHVSNNSGENEWYTPPKYLEAARKVMGCIDLDPASCEFANRNVKAKKYFTKYDNALTKEWNYGNVWLNPPYSQPEIQLFANKVAVREFEQAIVLVNNATETAWFQTMAKEADYICFNTARIRFLDNKGIQAKTPLQGQAFLYFGDNPEQFVNVFSEFGLCVSVSRPKIERSVGIQSNLFN